MPSIASPSTAPEAAPSAMPETSASRRRPAGLRLRRSAAATAGSIAAVWPRSADELIKVQRELAAAEPPPWRPIAGSRPLIGACFACAASGSTGPGASGEPGWAAAVVLDGRRAVTHAVVAREVGAPYEAGLL